MKINTHITINGCNECPFKNYSYDDFAMGDPESNHCNLLKDDWMKTFIETNKVSYLDYFIYFYKNGKVKSKNKRTLDNCPLLLQNLNIELNEK